MYYLAHLALSAFVILVMAVIGTQFELSASWGAQVTDQFADLYMMFAVPYWIWAAISSYLEASMEATVGGFIGLHLLLFSVWFLVAQSTETAAANGWLFYFLGSPIVVAIGGCFGRHVALRKARQSD